MAEMPSLRLASQRRHERVELLRDLRVGSCIRVVIRLVCLAATSGFCP